MSKPYPDEFDQPALCGICGLEAEECPCPPCPVCGAIGNPDCLLHEKITGLIRQKIIGMKQDSVTKAKRLDSYLETVWKEDGAFGYSIAYGEQSTDLSYYEQNDRWMLLRNGQEIPPDSPDYIPNLRQVYANIHYLLVENEEE